MTGVPAGYARRALVEIARLREAGIRNGSWPRRGATPERQEVGMTEPAPPTAGEAFPPCVICAKPVIVSVFDDQAVHHRCAWYARKHESAPKDAPGTTVAPTLAKERNGTDGTA